MEYLCKNDLLKLYTNHYLGWTRYLYVPHVLAILGKGDLNAPHLLHVGQVTHVFHGLHLGKVTYMFPMCHT